MSCHDIGRGLNSVVTTVLELYDKNQIAMGAAREIIAACRRGVYYCDGNEEEAVFVMSRCRCGKCLRVVEKGKPLYPLDCTSLSYDLVNKIMNNGSDLASGELCEKCFDETLEVYCRDIHATDREKQYIYDNYSEKEYLSEGDSV